MKWLVWLLLLANVALFGYFQLVAAVPDEATRPRRDLAAERLEILDPQALASLPPKTAAPSVPPVSSGQMLCYEWGSFSATDATEAQAVLNRMGIQTSIRQPAPQEAVRYWVYIPPRKSMEEAQAKVKELRAFGIEESFIVQEPKWRFAISLGVFKEEALADKYLEALKARGVRSAIKGLRNHETDPINYLLRDVSPQQAEELARLKPQFPGSELKPTDCF
ncbi:MAG: SPOR domain-containing protein [Methylophilaceae bacterium]|nr:SPOR domain-containing protein [Methylophilaceae bacterium]